MDLEAVSEAAGRKEVGLEMNRLWHLRHKLVVVCEYFCVFTFFLMCDGFLFLYM